MTDLNHAQPAQAPSPQPQPAHPHSQGHDFEPAEIDSGVVKDWADARDVEFVPISRAPLPESLELSNYREFSEETWHQRGEECTGFALAAIANYLMRRQHGRSEPSVSRRMLYEMAQRYDGAMHVEGSTLRGALKGWSRLGVATDAAWPYHPDDEHGDVHGSLTLSRVLDGRQRPLMGYRRIVDEDAEAMRRALAEGRPVYAAARTHVGWYRLFLDSAGRSIERRPADKTRGIHAFVIIGFDDEGFHIHNSWGPEWGDDGYAMLPYDQWEWGATDAWVVDAGIDRPTDVPRGPVVPDIAAQRKTYRSLWPHLVVLGDDGRFADSGLYEMDEGSIKTMLYLFDEFTRSQQWPTRRLALIADGGQFGPAITLERLAPLRDQLLAAHVYPIFLVWETGWQSDLQHELLTWMEHRATNSIAGHALADDVAGKVAAAESRCRAGWELIDHRCAAACARTRAASTLARWVNYKRDQRGFDLYVAAIGAGDLLMHRFATMLRTPLTGAVTLGSPTTLQDVLRTYGDMLNDGCLQHLTSATLTETAETQDHFGPADDSLLELVASVWTEPSRIMRRAGHQARQSKRWPLPASPLLGHESTANHPSLAPLLERDAVRFVGFDDLAHDDWLGDARVRQLLVEELSSRHKWQPPSDAHQWTSRDPLVRAAARLGQQR